MNFKKKLFTLLFIAYTVRVYASLKGGQFFIVDELRYGGGHHFVSYLSDFEFLGGVTYLLNCSAHTLFTLFAALAEVIRYLGVIMFIDSSLPPYELNNSKIGIEISAIFLSTASVLNILIIYFVVKSFNGTKIQGYISSILLSLSLTNFYFSRHLVPYDCSISLSLISFYFAGKSRTNIKYQLFCGIFSGLSTLTYFGYWPLAIVAWLSCILRNKSNYIMIAIWCGLGGVMPLLLLQGIGYIVGVNYIQNVWDFILLTKFIQMGDPYSGLNVFIDYMWKAENILFYFILFFCLVSIYYVNFSSYVFLNHRSIGLFSSVLILLILFYLTQIKGSFVLYGRTIKMIVPFLCIACSYPLFVLLKTYKNRIYSNLIIYSLITVIIISTFNHLKFLNVVYPRDFKREASNITENFEEISSFTGVNVRKNENPNPKSSYSLVNAQWLVPPLTKAQKSLPNGSVLLRENHPYSSFSPYLFLHYNKEERTIIENSNLEMLLIKKNE